MTTGVCAGAANRTGNNTSLLLPNDNIVEVHQTEKRWPSRAMISQSTSTRSALKASGRASAACCQSVPDWLTLPPLQSAIGYLAHSGRVHRQRAGADSAEVP